LEIIPFAHTNRRKKAAIDREASPTSELDTEIPGVNRSPALTIWAAVVAKFLGFEHGEALTLGRAVAGLNAYLKGVSLVLFQPTPTEVRDQRRKMRKDETVKIECLHRAVPAKHTGEGLSAATGQEKIQLETLITAGPKAKRQG